MSQILNAQRLRLLLRASTDKPFTFKTKHVAKVGVAINLNSESDKFSSPLTPKEQDAEFIEGQNN